MAAFVLRDPRALAKPEILNLLKRAVEAGTFLAPNGWDTVARDIVNFVVDENQFMILGIQDGKFVGCVLGYFPGGNLFPYPTVVSIYNEGSRETSRELRDELLETLMNAGYTRMLAVNTSGHEDGVWLRGLTPEGATGSIVGSLAMFEVK